VADGGSVMWNNGLVQVNGPDQLLWGWLLNFIWMFLVYVSLFGFVAQFIYRYLTLNRSIILELIIKIKMFNKKFKKSNKLKKSKKKLKIYYMVLNRAKNRLNIFNFESRSMHISAEKYFVMLGCILLVPLTYIIIAANDYFPPPDHKVLMDKSMASLLDLPANQPVYFSAYTAGVCK
jgi:hypothetical protein